MPSEDDLGSKPEIMDEVGDTLPFRPVFTEDFGYRLAYVPASNRCTGGVGICRVMNIGDALSSSELALQKPCLIKVKTALQILIRML